MTSTPVVDSDAPDWVLGLVGALAVAIGLGAGDVTGALVSNAWYPSVSDQVLRWMPAQVDTWVSDAHGGLLLWGVGILVLLLGSASSLLSRRRRIIGFAVPAVLGLLAILSTILPPTFVVRDLAAPVVATAVALATLAVFRRRVLDDSHTRAFRGMHRVRDDSKRDPRQRGISAGSPMARRRVLVAGSALAVGAGLAGPVLRLATVRPGPDPAALTMGRDLPGSDGPPLAAGGPVVDVRDRGAVGDGVTDDGAAIRAAFNAAIGVSGTVFFPPGTYYYRATGPLTTATGLAVSGVPGASILAMDTVGGQYTPFCIVTGDRVTVDGLTVRRVGDFPSVLFVVRQANDLTLNRIVLDGRQRKHPASYCHALQLGSDSTANTRGLTITNSTFTGMTYGLFQNNESRAISSDIRVRGCAFLGNGQTDLEFNSPNGRMSGVAVEHCSFTGGSPSGFGVGLAFVGSATIEQNTFTGYSTEAVHVEDYSDTVLIQDNVFTACGLRRFGHIQVIGGSRAVRITRNMFRAEMNEAPILVINALAGNELTGGGRPPTGPSDLRVDDNQFECSASVRGAYLGDVQDAVVTGNRLRGDGVTERAFVVDGGARVTVTNNYINGALS